MGGLRHAITFARFKLVFCGVQRTELQIHTQVTTQQAIC